MPDNFARFNQIECFWTDFHTDVNVKFHVSPSSGYHAGTCEQTDGRTDSLLPFQSKKELLRRFSVAGSN
jgi:hypothetical protein